MAQYKVSKKCFIDGVFYDEGSVVDVSVKKPSEWMEELKAEKPKRAQKKTNTVKVEDKPTPKDGEIVSL